MKSFECHIPGILFGSGRVHEIGRVAASLGRKALLTIDPYLHTRGLGDEITALLKETSVDIVIWSDIQPNPDCFGADRAAAVAREERCDMVIGVGGGSASDFAIG